MPAASCRMRRSPLPGWSLIREPPLLCADNIFLIRSVPTDGEQGDGRNMPWDIEKYRISIAITEGTDGNALFTYTVTVNHGSAHQGKFCTINYQSATKVSDLETVTLSFASLWVAYEISNVTVTDIQ